MNARESLAAVRRAAPALAWIELRLLLREPVTVVFSLAFPLVILLVLSEVFGNVPEVDDDGTPLFLGAGPIDYYVPVYVVLVSAAVGLISVPVHLASYRERGVMRRLRASGASAGAVALALGATAVVISLAGGAAVLVAAAAVYRTGMPDDAPRVLAGLAAVLVWSAAIGVLLGALLPSARAAQGVGMTLFVGMMFIAGAGPPPETLSGPLRAVADVLPLTHAVRTVQDPWLGLGWRPLNLAVVLGTLVAAAAGAALLLARE